MLGIALFIPAVERRSIAMLGLAAFGLALSAMASYQAFVSAAILLIYLWYNDLRWKPAWLAALDCTSCHRGPSTDRKTIDGIYTGSCVGRVFERVRFGGDAQQDRKCAGSDIAYRLDRISAAGDLGVPGAMGVGRGGSAGRRIHRSEPAILVFLRCRSDGDCIVRRLETGLPSGLGVAVFCVRTGRIPRWLSSVFAADGRAGYPTRVARKALAAHRLCRADDHQPGTCLSELSTLGRVPPFREFPGERDGEQASLGELRMGILLEGAGSAARWLAGQTIHPGEMLITSDLGFPAPINVGGGQLTPVAEQEIRATLPLRLIGLDAKSGYSTATALVTVRSTCHSDPSIVFARKS